MDPKIRKEAEYRKRWILSGDRTDFGSWLVKQLAQHEQDQLDAQRYRKLKANRKGAMLRIGDNYISWENIDAAVDALPEAE